MQTIEQQRAKFALKKVQENIAVGVKQKEFQSYASSLPAMIHMNGLGQAAAFLKSKGNTKEKNHVEYKALYQLLSDWLTQEKQPYAKYDDLLSGITDADMQHYQLAQIESQALMNWVKKFAKAFMGES